MLQTCTFRIVLSTNNTKPSLSSLNKMRQWLATCNKPLLGARTMCPSISGDVSININININNNETVNSGPWMLSFYLCALSRAVMIPFCSLRKCTFSHRILTTTEWDLTTGGGRKLWTYLHKCMQFKKTKDLGFGWYIIDGSETICFNQRPFWRCMIDTNINTSRYVLVTMRSRIDIQYS